jgi:phage terminase large subunit GpA-like protein
MPGTSPGATCEKWDLAAPAFQQVAEHVGAERTTAYFAQLLSEKLVTTYSRGTPVREWRRKEGMRGEVLDCRVYKVAPQAPPKVSDSRWMNA